MEVVAVVSSYWFVSGAVYADGVVARFEFCWCFERPIQSGSLDDRSEAGGSNPMCCFARVLRLLL